MTKWIVLGAAIVAEVTASLSLKAAQDTPAFYALVAAGYLAAFALIIKVLKLGMPLGVAYGIWGASGVAATAILSSLLFDEPLTGVMFAGIGLIIVGVLAVEIGSQKATEARATTESSTTMRGAL
ncbi:small multidrug resistance pump [Klenkia soli]|uniref:Small multidrug resistance pump n=1 Tax=Klenkia soli TaxID=1052260 RepID=A0A1H0GR92_9ACTN|nr:SMR family transporter [Klenkia soli]SDO09339.1 small multidrug resistance pump [Klenkia soli]